MCGWAFLLGYDISGEQRRAYLQTAMGRLRHRGPDQSGLVLGNDYGLAHTRLSIVDLAGGRQPLQDPSGRWALAFNGEIYNYRLLRKELRGQWSFRDSSDTEVLLAGLVLQGESFVEKLDGMWSFVLHDGLSGRVLLSRDRFGKKPLMYTAGPNGALAAASELPALKALVPNSVWHEDLASVSDYFRYGFVLPGRTCFGEVFELLPGHSAVLERGAALIARRYWAPSTERWRGSRQDAAAEVRRLLVAAVSKRRLAADVEVGAFLSGGIDSTVICALAQEGGIGKLQTFTAGFGEQTYDERGPARAAAAALGTRHSEEELRPEEARELARAIPARLGQPFADASIIPSALVARAAARSVKVVLTGDGGDEVFGGYARYLGRLLMRRYFKLPALVRSTFERSLAHIPEPISHHSGSLLKRAHLFLKIVNDRSQAYTAPLLARTAQISRLVPELGPGTSPPAAPWPSDSDELRHMMLMDWLVWLPQDILAKLDRATMMFSLEGRCPFLDRDLVEFVIRLPWEWHVQGLHGKQLLRAAIGRRIPQFVWRRRKQGFAPPIAHWMQSGLGEDLIDLARSSETGAMDRMHLIHLATEHRSGEFDHSQILWAAYCYLSWRRACLSDDVIPSSTSSAVELLGGPLG